MDDRQVLLLIVAIAVPLFLFIQRRPRLVLGWVCITLFVHIFDTQILTNLPAGRIVGLLYMGRAVATMPSWLRLRPARAWMVNLAYALLLGILFGYIWPWPDTTGRRAFNMTAPGRTIVFMIRLLADTSLTIFVMRQLRKPGSVLFLGRAMALGALLTALAGLPNLVKPDWDPYAAITGIRDYIAARGMDRARGLSFEPRGLGMACVYGLIILAIYPRAMSLKKMFQMVIDALALLASYSASSFALLIVALGPAWVFLSRKARGAIIGTVVISACFILIAMKAAPERFDRAVENIQQRIDPTYKLQGATAQNLAQAIAFRMDSFDASALLFLLDKPQYALIGAGPGMVLLPATEYIPPGIYSLLYSGGGLDGLPTIGPLFEVSNTGIVGLIVWLIQVVYGWRALHLLARSAPDEALRREWRFGQAIFTLGVIFYVVQVSPTSPIWSVMLGIGWAAVQSVHEQRRRMGAGIITN